MYLNIKSFTVNVVLLLGLSGCSVTEIANSEWANKNLQTISAGYTGCFPKNNKISFVSSEGIISDTWSKGFSKNIWMATCKGKIYLCSYVGKGESYSYSCVPSAE